MRIQKGVRVLNRTTFESGARIKGSVRNRCGRGREEKEKHHPFLEEDV